jgi:hypothetical protein
MGLPGNLLSVKASFCRRCGVARGLENRQILRQRSQDIVWPLQGACGNASNRDQDVPEPMPAGQNFASGLEYPEKPLRPAFIVDQRSRRLREGSCGQYHMGLFGRGVFQLV